VEPKETVRIEGFSDAVFAIAITLLGTDLRVPPPGGPGLIANLFAQWPEYFSFLSSFGTIAIAWIYHHKLFALIRRADHTLLLLNCLLLLGVTVMPYSRKILAEYIGGPDVRAAAMVNDGTFIITAVFFNLLWRYASAHSRLLDSRADPHAISVISRMIAIVPLMYLGSFLLASVSAVASTALNLVLVVFFAIPKQLDPNLPGT
jgi:uncharacterized membrane protein